MMPVAEPAWNLVAPSFNGRTAASGAAYRGSNPWGAANTLFHTSLKLPPSELAIKEAGHGLAGAFENPQHDRWPIRGTFVPAFL